MGVGTSRTICPHLMPNQRKAGLVYISAHTDPEKRAAFDDIWKERKYTSRSAAIDALVTVAMTKPDAIKALLRIGRK